MHAVVSDRREELAELCRRHGVARLDVFGSAARGEDFDERASDVDFLVEFADRGGDATLREYLDFANALRETVGRRVDLVEAEAVANPYMRAAIEESREAVHPPSGDSPAPRRRAGPPMRRDARVPLSEIEAAAGAVARFTEGMDLDAFAGADATRAAVEWKIQVAAARMEAVKASFPGIAARLPPPRALAELARLPVGGRPPPAPGEVWRCARNDLPGLGEAAGRILDELGRLE